MADLNSKIFGTSVTLGYIEERLQMAFGCSCKFGPNIQITRLGVGEGFMSVIARIKPDWQPANSKLPDSIIVKIPSVNILKELLLNPATSGSKSYFEKLIESISAHIHRGHNSEVAFYKQLQACNLELNIPKMYYGEEFSEQSKQGMLLLEDVGNNAVVEKVYSVIGVNEIKQVLLMMAKLQGFFLKHHLELNNNRLTFTEMVKTVITKKVLAINLESIKKFDPEGCSTLCDQIADNIDKLYNAETLDNVQQSFGSLPILIHGDLWTANVMWRIDNDGSRKLASVIDWQMVHTGSPAEDIVRLVSCTLLPVDRRNCIDQLLHWYYKQLEEAYGSKLPFQLQQLKDSYIRVCPYAMLMTLPIIGRLTLVHLDGVPPAEKQQRTTIAKRKIKGLLEDVLYYGKLSNLI